MPALQEKSAQITVKSRIRESKETIFREGQVCNLFATAAAAGLIGLVICCSSYRLEKKME